MIDTILWRFKDSAGHPAALTLGDLVFFALLLLLLFLFCLLMAKRRKTCIRIRNYGLIPLAAVGGFAIYAIGYLHGGTANSLTALTIRSFLSTFHMFFLHSDLLEVCEEMHHDKVYMTFFSLIHFLAFLISFLVVVQLLGTHFLSWIRLKCAAPRRSYLFFGLNGGSVTLATSLLERKERARFVVVLDKKGKSKGLGGGHSGGKENSGDDQENRETGLERLGKTDALLLNRGYSENTTFREAGIKKLLKRGEARLFLLSGDTVHNVRLALKMADEIKNGNCYRAEITLYVRVDDEGVAGLLENRKFPENVEIRIVHPARLSALELIRNYPPVDYVRPDPAKAVATEDFTAMVLGFGETGSNVLRALTEHGQFIGAEFRVTVVDKDLDGRLGTFESRYPGMKHYNIDYVSTDVNSVAFWEVLRAKLDTLDYLVISLGDSSRNIQVAVDIERFVRRVSGREIDLFVKVDGDSLRGYAAFTALLPSGHIHTFGADSTIYTEDLIVNEVWWTLAKDMHRYYCLQKEISQAENSSPKASSSLNRKILLRKNRILRKKNPTLENGLSEATQYFPSAGNTCEVTTGMKWERLPELRKLSNLSAALHLVTKLKLAGLFPEMIKNQYDKIGFLGLLGEGRLENLAKGEHLHWNATLFAHGWDTWKDIPREASENKDENRKLHACLVDWEELPGIEKRFGEPYRDYDRVYVENIYDWMQDSAIFEEVDEQFRHHHRGKEIKID